MPCHATLYLGFPTASGHCFEAPHPWPAQSEVNWQGWADYRGSKLGMFCISNREKTCENQVWEIVGMFLWESKSICLDCRCQTIETHRTSCVTALLYIFVTFWIISIKRHININLYKYKYEYKYQCQYEYEYTYQCENEYEYNWIYSWIWINYKYSWSSVS